MVINQAYRYNNTLGEIVLGMRAKAGGGYEVVSQTGRYLSVTMSTPEDAATKAIIDPYVAVLATYNNTVIGQTTVADRRPAGLHRRRPTAPTSRPTPSVFELAKNGITTSTSTSPAR